MGLLDQLKKREEVQYTKMQNKDYYFSEESGVKGRQLYQDKKEYVKNNPQDYEIVAAQMFKTLWNYVDELPDDERMIFTLTGK